MRGGKGNEGRGVRGGNEVKGVRVGGSTTSQYNTPTYACTH